MGRQCSAPRRGAGGAKRATSLNMPLLWLQSSEGKFGMSVEIEPVRRSFCRRRSCTFAEVARLVRSARDAARAGGAQTVVLVYCCVLLVSMCFIIVIYLVGGGRTSGDPRPNASRARPADPGDEECREGLTRRRTSIMQQTDDPTMSSNANKLIRRHSAEYCCSSSPVPGKYQAEADFHAPPQKNCQTGAVIVGGGGWRKSGG